MFQVGPPTGAESQDSTQTRRHLQSDMNAFEDSGAAVRPAEGIGFEEVRSGFGARRSLAGIPAVDAVFVLFTFDFSDVGARTASLCLWLATGFARSQANAVCVPRVI